jgi:hypothetical protein
MIVMDDEEFIMICRDLTPSERQFLGILRYSEKSVGRRMLSHMVGCTEWYIINMVSALKTKLTKHGLRVRCSRGKGYYLTMISAHDDAADRSYIEKRLDSADMSPWAPSHVGDPLLDALKREHSHGNGTYPGYRGPNEARV